MASLRELTEKEISLVPSYRQIWYDTAFSTTRINHKEVQNVVQSIYKIFDLEIPRIHFCNNLYALVEKSRNLFQQPYFCEDGTVFASRVMAQIHELHMSFFESIGHWDMALTSQLRATDGQSVEYNISTYLQQKLLNDLPICFQGYEMYTHWIFPRIWYTDEASLFDFHFSVAQQTLFKAYDDTAWQVYRKLIQKSSWFTAFESDCFVCERPKEFLFNCHNTLPSSILFVDGEQLTFID
jgi:hypothetical protein